MHHRFISAVNSLHDKFERLMAQGPYRFDELPKRMPESGVYSFSEGIDHLYVGRSNRLRPRYFDHCRPGSRQNDAPFAFKLAREKLGLTVASYKVGPNSRKGLFTNLEFASAFCSAKERIRRMHYRYVEETDQTRQWLLEAYCTLVLEARYNDFDTH